ncbi:MAG TPA: hypothetical protein VHT02_10150 [Methylocella sp.]|jgi:hypothetical protein|nr:hypothetical protein [Methylocella sp.]
MAGLHVFGGFLSNVFEIDWPRAYSPGGSETVTNASPNPVKIPLGHDDTEISCGASLGISVFDECALKVLPQWTTSTSELPIDGDLQCLRE